MTPMKNPDCIRFAIAKGRMYDGIVRLLEDAGIRVLTSSRGYRPAISLDGFETKILKPRAIVDMLAAGARDVGFAGADWVSESRADVVEMIDTGLDPVRLVAAAPPDVLVNGRLPRQPLVVATEYVAIARRWIKDQQLDATVLPSFGATEVLPPEDADCIIDNTATGATLEANRLDIIDEIMTSSTRLYASRSALDDPVRRSRIEHLAMVVQSVLEARTRAMVEFNATSERLDSIRECLPCMREPTLAPLHGGTGCAVRVAVPRSRLPMLIPMIKSLGGADIVVSSPEQIVI